MWLYNENGQHLGWFVWGDALRISKHIDYAVYALAFCENMPSNKLLPCQVEDTIYVGLAGGKLFDKKHRTATGGSVETYLTKRLLTHNSQLNDLKKVREQKYKIFHETHAPELNRHKQLFYSISIPPEGMKKNMIRSFLHLCEKEYIFMYCKNFDGSPIMNIEQRLEEENRKQGSVSKRVMESPSLTHLFCKS